MTKLKLFILDTIPISLEKAVILENVEVKEKKRAVGSKMDGVSYTGDKCTFGKPDRPD